MKYTMDSTIWYSCNYCRRVYNDKQQLYLHKKNQHLNEIKANILKKKKSITVISDDNHEDHEDYHRNDDQVQITSVANESADTADNNCVVVNAFDILPPIQSELGESSADPILTLHYYPEGGDDEFVQVDNTSSHDVQYPIQNRNNDQYDENDISNSFVPKEEPEEDSSIEVIYIDSDTDDEDPSTMVDAVISAGENLSRDNNNSVIVHSNNFLMDTLTYHHQSTPVPSSSPTTTNNTTIYSNASRSNSQTELTTVRPSIKNNKQKCQKSTTTTTTTTPAIDKFLWCPVCLLPYTQISSLKRHMLLSHRNGTVRINRRSRQPFPVEVTPRNYEDEGNSIAIPIANDYHHPNSNNGTFNIHNHNSSNDRDKIERRSGGGAECVVSSYVRPPFLTFGEHY